MNELLMYEPKKSIMMKNYNLVLVVLIIFSTLLSCDKDDNVPIIPVHPQQIVVRYEQGLEESEKINIREKFGVLYFESCSCGDDIELWFFPQRGFEIPIEEIASKTPPDPDLEGLIGMDLNFTFTTKPSLAGYPEPDPIPEDRIVDENNGVTIAVLDTGINLEQFNFPDKFLYNNLVNETNTECAGEEDYYGWDFVNSDNTPEDTHGHGSVTTLIQTGILESQGITDYQILPVKIFGVDGESDYFTLLCGFKYALSKPEVDIIAMSFGWYGNVDGESVDKVNYELMINLIEEAETKNVLISASAGNGDKHNVPDKIGDDNDVPPYHYPSHWSASHRNVVSVAAMNSTMTELAPFSNYGAQTVGFAARGENINIDNSFTGLEGTSYANAYVVGYLAASYIEGMPFGDTIDMLEENTLYDAGLDMIKYSSFFPCIDIDSISCLP